MLELHPKHLGPWYAGLMMKEGLELELYEPKMMPL
jgi:hypothetical protein